MKKLNIVMLVVALAGLSACSTIAGVGQDITNTANQTGAYLSGH